MGAAAVIRSVEIKSLRGIRTGKLTDVTPLVVLVGPNGSGKSTVLDALLIAANPRPPDAIGLAAERRERVALNASARWLLWKAGQEGPAEITVTTDAGARECTFSIVGLSPNHTNIVGKIRDQDATGKTTETEIHMGFQAGQGAGRYGFFAPLGDVPEVRFLDPNAASLRTPLHQLYTRAVEQGLRKDAIASIQTLVPGIEDIQILAEGDMPVVYLIFTGYAVPAALAGDGIRLLLHLTFELATRPGGLVLMEEPEAHLHPGAIRQCARAILAAVRRGVQIVLSTHSLELIDALVSECSDQDLQQFSVYGLRLEEGILKSYCSPGPDVAFARTQIQEDLR
jgi:energy-coupling factor transporter ATP-binding protein EcfA2